ncbi:MAG TPA: filamentous hemagglutinin family protein [Smithella sp.]|nr:filamentous hemagglutinin family protein [Smithella sp.]
MKKGSRVLLKKAYLPGCAADRTAQCISVYPSLSGFLCALPLCIIEQLRNMRSIGKPAFHTAAVFLLLCCCFMMIPFCSVAGTLTIPGFNSAITAPPATNALPVLKNPGVLPAGVSSLDTSTANKLVIHQDQSQAIIDWSSFNIGADAWVQFDQQGHTSWAALNRIYDQNPSLIFGKLTADGKIYLINQNGILFGPGSQVNVYSLVASALNIRNDDFIKSSLNFYLETGTTTNDVDLSGNPYSYSGLTYNASAAVSNFGQITAATGGSVFLIGPNVENYGSIDAKMGQIGLAAGTQVSLITPTVDPEATEYQRTALIVDVTDGFGQAVNREGGQLTADMGLIGMYGGIVNQDGLIRSVTAVNYQGRIELVASDKIVTGSNSTIESPISTSSDTSVTSTSSFGGVVNMSGNFGNPENPSSAPTGTIELNGTINVPSGTVNLSAADRVFLQTGSSISVAGAWSDESAQALAIQVQLNSVELADAYGQKDGILKGATITASILTGSSIGNINDAILNRQETALEQAIRAGAITINCSGGSSDIILKEGAVLDFSGGGIRYSGGVIYTTELVSGGKIYDISNAPLYLHYDKIIEGLGTYVQAHTQGGDAGTLTLVAGTVVLDGQLRGSATRGAYQNTWTAEDSTAGSSYLLSVAQGLEIPRGGTLIIGNTPTETKVGEEDAVVKEISVENTAAPSLGSSFGPNDNLPNDLTVIPVSTINAAGLSNLYLSADTTITTDSGTQINLLPGGTFTAYARSIEHNGSIIVPSGTITLKLSDYLPPVNGLSDRIFLASGSILDVSGQKIDNTLKGNTSAVSYGAGQIGGGTINILDETDNGQGVFVKSGAVVDVSGGYFIDSKGNVTGGNAGALMIQGTNIMLDGDLRGYALADASGKIRGGSITINSTDITVANASSEWPQDFTADSDVPADMAGKFIIAGNRFADTGFTQIALNSLNDILIEPGVSITTSLVRLNYPSSGLQTGNAVSGYSQAVAGRPDLIRLDDSIAYMAGASSFTAAAGQTFSGSYMQASNNMRSSVEGTQTLTVSTGSLISTAPGGKITLSAPAEVDIAGTLQALGGKINIKTTGDANNRGDVKLEDGGQILAAGYNLPDATATVPGFGVNRTPESGGTVTLSAAGNIILDQGSLIDISGSAPVENALKSTDGKIIQYADAGSPGTLSLTFQGDLTWQGDVYAKAQMNNIQGGTLSISATNLLSLSDGDFQKYLTAGFDSLTLKSYTALQFTGDINESLGRELTLDAPVIACPGGNTVSLGAPWIVLANTSPKEGGQPTSGDGHLTLDAIWLDINGSIIISGFKDVNLDATRDIRLTDQSYTSSYVGKLYVAGDLTMKADRIYPTTNSTFSLFSTGEMTILPADIPVGGDIYSAGGNLILGALGGIDIEGVVAAPMGTIVLQNYLDDSSKSTGGRIYLANGSIVTTVGDAMVKYGDLDANGVWTVTDESGKVTTVNNTPANSITINAAGGDVVAASTAKIDASGGGSIFSYLWQKGIEGSVNPLTKPGRYVVISDNSIQLPGASVYITGGGGLAAGTYSLLPIEYAFLPGAYIIEVQSTSVIPVQGAVSKEGYSLTVGYASVANTAIQATKPVVYSVRSAADVLAEGNFETTTLTAGNGGNITVSGKTTIIDCILQATALTGYQGGVLNLSGLNIIVQQSGENDLPSNFDFTTALDSSLQDKMIISAESISGKSFSNVNLGGDEANSIEIDAGAVVDANNISLTANKTTSLSAPSITIQSGAKLGVVNSSGVSGTDEISLATTGNLNIADGSVLYAKNNIILDVNNVEGINGKLQVDNSAITLKSSNIYFGETAPSSATGLHVTDDVLNLLSGYKNITFTGENDIQFLGATSLSANGSLTLDASIIVGIIGGTDQVKVSAPAINLQNTGSASTATAAAANAGQISFTGDKITVGSGDVLFSGFSTISLNSTGDVTFKGAGSLATGGADLQINAARVTTTQGVKTDGTYQAADFLVVAGNSKTDLNPAHSITMTNSGGSAGTTSTPGGTLEFFGKSIDDSSMIQVDGGDIKLVAAGAGASDGVFLHNGAQILARGTDDAPGGRVTLQAIGGKIALDAGSLIDVSAGAQKDAGSVTLLAPSGGVTINGTLSGHGSGGAGGSFTIDTLGLTDTDTTNLIGVLATGGFNDSINITTRQGNIDVVAGQTLQAGHVQLTADDNSSGNGQINVYGTIDADTADGSGKVELYAMNDININNSTGGAGMISTAGTTSAANGGYVILSSAQGYINAGGTLNVSGGGSGTGGIVYLRALRDGSDVQINLNGGITGASDVYAEAFKIYDYASTSKSQWISEAQSYYAGNTAVGRLEGSAPAGAATFHLLPGIELTSTGDITISGMIDLTGYRFQTQHDIDIGKAPEAGVLTLRAAGDLNINANLVDHPTSEASLSPSSAQNSWGFNLVAGADTASANYMSVNSGGTGNLTIGDTKLVYTESSPIRFASGGDTIIGTGQSSSPNYMINSNMTYNLASYDGSIEGVVGRDLQINGGAIQTATGDIDITVGGDLILTTNTARGLNTLGAIRTTGWSGSESNPANTNYWTYTGGGNIDLNVGGNLGMKNDLGNWTTAYVTNGSQWDSFIYKWNNNGTLKYAYWSANYGTAKTNPTAGLATMGGGDLVVRTGGDFLAQAGAFGQEGEGSLTIYAGGDIKGRFLDAQGAMGIHSMGNFGSASQPQVIEIFDSQINITALGDIDLATVVNPYFTNMLTSLPPTGKSNYYILSSVNIGYSEDASLDLKAGGDVTLGDNDPFHDPWNIHAEEILPSTVIVTAGKDILIKHDYALLPSPTGNLTLIAKGSIDGTTNNSSLSRSQIFVSDMDPANVYNGAAAPAVVDDLFLRYSHAASPIHANDPVSIEISAGQNIENLELFLPKKAEIVAEQGNIVDVFYYGQNVNSGDISEIIATQGNIIFSALDNTADTGFVQAGPGALFVQAGGYISLGNAVSGIQSVGNYFNPVLGEKGSDLIILSGYNKEMTPSDVETFFDTIRAAGTEYSTLMAEGNKDEADSVLQQVRTQTITPLLGSPSGSGDIDMTTSQISTNSGKDNIYIIANGKLDIGKSTFFENEADRAKTGIFTAGGGAINIFAGEDVNVNESRVMTFEGGDITVWSDYGNINAGRGSKEEVVASPPHLEPIYDASGNNVIGYSVVFTPPAVGSGIRAVTFDPDGAVGPLSAPPAGDIYLFAIRGIIDAGEAGIAGGKVVLAATEVLNAGNISFTTGSIGVPSVSTAATGIGALSGSGSAMAGSQMLSNASVIGAANSVSASQIIDDVMAKWLDVKVMDFIIGDENDGGG